MTEKCGKETAAGYSTPQTPPRPQFVDQTPRHHSSERYTYQAKDSGRAPRWTWTRATGARACTSRTSAYWVQVAAVSRNPSAESSNAFQDGTSNEIECDAGCFEPTAEDEYRYDYTYTRATEK